MSDFIENILSFIFPRRCPFCGAPLPQGSRVCGACAEKLPVVTGRTCMRCGRGTEYCNCGGLHFAFERCAAPFYYEDIVRKGIVNFKFYARQTSAEAFAFYAAKTVMRAYVGERFDFVTCVPLTHAEHRKRGFNQSEVFARALARELSLPYRESLVKPRDVRPQRELSAKERWTNIDGAFCAVKQLQGECVLLVDDIMTTGATLDACAGALKDAGARKIHCAVIACVK